MPGRAFRRGVWVLALSGGGILAFLGLLNQPSIQNKILRRVLPELSAQAGVSLDIRDLRWNIPGGRLEIDDLELRRAPGDLAFLRVGRAELSLDYRRLRQGVAALRDVRATGVTLDISRLPDGELNLPGSTSPSPSAAGSLPPRVSLRDVTLMLNDGPVSACLRDVSIDLEAGRLRIESSTPGAISLGRSGGAIDQLRFQGSLAQASFDALRGAGVLRGALGGVPGLGSLSVEAEFDLDGAAERLGFRSFGVRSALGQATGSGTLSLRDEDSRAQVTIRSAGVTATTALAWKGLHLAAATADGRVTVARNDAQGAGRFVLGPTRLDLTIDRLAGYGATLAGAVSVGRDTWSLAGQLRGNYPIDQKPLRGQIDFTARLTGSASDPRAAVSASGRLAAGPIEGIDLTAEAEVDRRRIQIPGATLDWNGQRVTARGQVNLTTRQPQLDAKISASSLDLQPLLTAFGRDLPHGLPIDGQLSFDAQLAGDVTDPNLELSLQGRDLIAYGEPLGQLDAAASYRNGFVELSRLELRRSAAQGSGGLSGRGWADLTDETFRFETVAENFRFDSLTVPLPRSAGETTKLPVEITARAALAGTFAAPRGTVQLDARTGAVPSLSVRGTFEDGRFSATATAPQANLENFQLPVRFGMQAALAGPVADLRGIEGEVELTNFEADLGGGVTVTSQGSILVGLAGQAIEARRVLLESAAAALAIRGRLPWEGARPGESLKLAGAVPLSQLQPFLPPGAPLELEGTLSVAGEILGSLRTPQPRLVVETAAATIRSPQLVEPVSDIQLRAVASGADVRLEKLSAAFAGGVVEADAVVPWPIGDRAPLAATAQVRFRDLNPLRLRPEVAGKLRSQVSGVINLTAKDWTIDGLSADGRLTRLTIEGPNGLGSQTRDTRFSLRRSQLSIDDFDYKGNVSAFSAAGTVSAVAPYPLDLRLNGVVDTEFFSPASGEFGLAGPVELNLRVRGPAEDAEATGNARWRSGRVFLTSPPLAIDDLDAQVTFSGRRAEVTSLKAVLNGGRVEGRGSVAFDGRTLGQVDLALNGRGVFLEFPKGFQTASNVALTLRNRGRTLILGGEINVLDGSYREAIDLGFLTRNVRVAPSLSSEPNTILENLRFDVALRTRQPILVDNNFGRILTDANLRLRGTPARPALTGRLEIGDEGRIYFSGRTFDVTSGVIEFTDETSIVPRFNLAAETRISNYDVILRLTGEPGNLKTTFSSEPSANEDQILSLLFTGSVSNAGRGAAYAQAQLLTLFGSSLTGGLTTRLRNTFGLSEFRIDPGILSPDSDPSARLTIGQNLTPELKLTYSTSLSDSQDQIWIAEYDWRRRFLARYFRQTDQSNRLEFRQKLRWGGGDQTGDFSVRPPRRRLSLAAIDITGTPVFPRPVILKQLGLRAGRRFDFLKAQRGIEKLKRYYAARGYAEVRIQQDRREENDRLYLSLEIDAGNPVRFVYEGDEPSQSARRRVESVWRQGLIEQQRLRTATQSLLQSYLVRGYADVQLDATVNTSGDRKSVVFNINRGQKYGRPEIVFQSAPAALAEEMIDALHREQRDRLAKANPAEIAQFLTRFLNQRGYLAARVDKPRLAVEGQKLVMTIPMFAGPDFRLGRVRFTGNREIAEADLRAAMVAAEGDPYVPEDRYTIARRVQQLYWNRGYRRADVNTEEKYSLSTGRADLTITIEENTRYQVAAVEVKGLSKTSERFVRRRLTLGEGDPLSAEKINTSRRNLLDSGAYNLIDFTFPPAGAVTPSPTGAQPVTLQLSVREPKPFRFDYGLTYDTTRGIGGIVDVSTQNVLGEARTVGFRTVADGQRQEYRGYFNQPFLGRRRIGTTGTVFHQRDVFPVLDDLRFDVRTTGATLQQYVQFGPRFTWTYGYRVDSATAFVDVADTRINASRSTSQLVTALSRDSRDNVLDATRGSFLSTTVEHAPSWLGGDINFTRVYQQAFKYFGLSKPGRMPFEAEQRRSRLVFATGARVGFIAGSQGDLFLPIDLFFAGGGTSIRGFEQNSIGPGVSGGRATLVLNNELRFPLYKILDGVAFFDTGNVWERPSDFRLTDLRAGTGVGIRIRNPFVILRFDYGWKVSRRPGESAGGFFFSIGQAF